MTLKGLSTYKKNNMFINIIASLLLQIQRIVVVLTEFLLALFLGGVTAVLFAIPWLFRFAAILVWLIAAFSWIQTIQLIYAPATNSTPLFALQFAAILLMVAWAIAAIRDGKQIWGVLIAGGLVGWLLSILAIWLFEHWEYADVFFKVLPPTLFAVGMIFSVTRARRLTHG